MPWLDILSIETPDGVVTQVGSLPDGEPYPIEMIVATHDGHEYGLRFCVATTSEGRFSIGFALADSQIKIFDTDPETNSPEAIHLWFLKRGCPVPLLMGLLERCKSEIDDRRKDQIASERRN